MSDANSTESGIFKKIPLTRRNSAGMIFMSCEGMPGLFLTATRESEIRDVIDSGLKVALQDEGSRVQVYTNGSVDGPIIKTVVEITE